MIVLPNANICSYSPFIGVLIFFLINVGIWIYLVSATLSSCNGNNDMDCSFFTFGVVGHSFFLLFVICGICIVIRQFRRVREIARQRQGQGQGQPYFNSGQDIYGNDGNINSYQYNAANVPIDYQTNPQTYNNYTPNRNQPYANNNRNQGNYAPTTFYPSN